MQNFPTLQTTNNITADRGYTSIGWRTPVKEPTQHYLQQRKRPQQACRTGSICYEVLHRAPETPASSQDRLQTIPTTYTKGD